MRADKDLYSANDIRRMAMMKHPDKRTTYERWCVGWWKFKQVVGTIAIIVMLVVWWRAEHPSAPDQPVPKHHHHVAK